MPPILNHCLRCKPVLFCALSILPLFAFSPIHPSTSTHPARPRLQLTSIDKDSRRRWDSLVAEVYRKQDSLKKRIRVLDRYNTEQGWLQHSPDVSNSMEIENAFLRNRQERFEQIIQNLKTLKRSKIKYSVKILSAESHEGGTLYDSTTEGIVFNIGNTANFVHEITHGAQFERGSIAYKKARYIPIGDDIYDEMEAYLLQFAFDPGSIPSDTLVRSFPEITPEWVKKLSYGNDRPYADGGSAHLALIPIDINSPRDSLIKAYRYIPGIEKIFGSSYQLKKDPDLFYKH